MHYDPVSVVTLIRDDRSAAPERLHAILAQLAPADELILVDARGDTRAAAPLARLAESEPGRVRVHAFPEAVDEGEARDTGLAMARHPTMTVLGPDQMPAARWLASLRAALVNADVVYGQELHAPRRASAAAVARSLRDPRPARPDGALPETFATRENAGYRRYAFEAVRQEDDTPAPDERTFARRARLAGLRLRYAHEAVSERRETPSLAAEWRDRLQMGALRTPRLHLAWATVVGALGVAAVALANAWLLAFTALAFFAPTLRAVASPVARRYRPHHLAGGVALSPLLDMALLGGYITRRTHRRG